MSTTSDLLYYTDSTVSYRGSGRVSLGMTTRGDYTWEEFSDPFFQCWYEETTKRIIAKTEAFKRTLRSLKALEGQPVKPEPATLDELDAWAAEEGAL